MTEKLYLVYLSTKDLQVNFVKVNVKVRHYLHFEYSYSLINVVV